MRLVIRDEKLAASQYIAEYIVGKAGTLATVQIVGLTCIDRIHRFAPTQERPFVLGLPTGSSPILIYKILVEKHRAGEISFKDVVTFNMVRKAAFRVSKHFLMSRRMNTLASIATIPKATTRSCSSTSLRT